MKTDLYDQPITAIVTFLDCLERQIDIRMVLPQLQMSPNHGMIPNVSQFDCNSLAATDLTEGFFRCELTGHGYQGTRLDFLFCAASLKVAFSTQWNPLYPLDSDAHTNRIETYKCILKCLLLVFWAFRDDGGIDPYRDGTCLCAVCQEDTATFSIQSSNGEVLVEGNWEKLLNMLDGADSQCGHLWV